jgi:hypothetical protein
MEIFIDNIYQKYYVTIFRLDKSFYSTQKQVLFNMFCVQFTRVTTTL